VRLIPTKRDIAFVEYADEASATVAKDALHNFKIDGETKMKVGSLPGCLVASVVCVLKWIVHRSRSPGSRPSKRNGDQRSLFGWVSDALMYTNHITTFFRSFL
jgi:RNA recognition motif-containing protein